MEFNHPDDLNDIRKQTEKGADKHVRDIKIDFAAFILSMSTTALVALGDIPDPLTKETKKNIIVAKQMIDVINMLREKTKGNLTIDEAELIESLCSELKLKYLKAVDYK